MILCKCETELWFVKQYLYVMARQGSRNSDCSVFVANFDQRVTEELLWELFLQVNFVWKTAYRWWSDDIYVTLYSMSSLTSCVTQLRDEGHTTHILFNQGNVFKISCETSPFQVIGWKVLIWFACECL